MWDYERKLMYPVKIKNPNPKYAQIIISQYGGPDGEMGASMRYLSQRYSAPNRMTMAVLTDVGTEELAHLEMVATIVHQLTRDLTPEEIEKSGFAPYLSLMQYNLFLIPSHKTTENVPSSLFIKELPSFS